ncbi:MAG: nicotinate phosphoribosyltransferase [Bryobacterales bacterium]|nr:nicotinate phosphoribosyltransferase [Bryobacterales bacterium]
MNALLTDLYELTMGAGYVLAGKQDEVATFDLSIRKLAPNRGYAVAAGLGQVVEYLLNLRFEAEEIDYLRSLPQFQHAPAAYFDYLRDFRFRGDLFAVPEGTLLFAGEPVLTVRAPILEAQLAETYLLSTIGYQTTIATKASRMVRAAAGRAVVEFGTRRACSPEAGVIAGRAAYVGGCIGTSNTLAGMRYGIPVFGTAAHSWVQSFESEAESFRVLQQLLRDGTIYLIDTYDTIEGARHVANLGNPVAGVRLDSGDLTALSKRVRTILDAAGLAECRIMATGNLNEYKIEALLAEGAEVDSFGVGTDLVLSPDAPGMSVVYKLAEIVSNGRKRFTAKFSEDKETLPGGKQIFRHPNRDVIGCSWECPKGDVDALIEPVILQGELVRPPLAIAKIRDYALRQLKRLPSAFHDLEAPAEYPVELSEELRKLQQSVRASLQVADNEPDFSRR